MSRADRVMARMLVNDKQQFKTEYICFYFIDNYRNFVTASRPIPEPEGWRGEGLSVPDRQSLGGGGQTQEAGRGHSGGLHSCLWSMH